MDNETKIINYLTELKERFPSMCGANVDVISHDCKIENKFEVLRLCKRLASNGKIKQYKQYKNSFELGEVKNV